MKKFTGLAVLTLLAVLAVMSTEQASARPDYKKQFDAKYKDSSIEAAASEAKCNVCHYGKSKKNRNDYGTALSKILTKKDYDELKGDKPALAKKVEQALEKVLDQKSSGGDTFGDLIKAGKLPGTAPE